MQQDSFKEQFPKSHRPEMTDLEKYWDNDMYCLFKEFAETLLLKYDLRFGIPQWSENNGWKYRIGKSGIYIINGITIEKHGFIIDGIVVDNKEKYFLLLEHIDKVYQQNKEEFEKKIIEKNAKQAERNRARINRERKEFESIQTNIKQEVYNIFCWPKKLDIHKLNKLYMLDAKGIQDDFLVDEIGLTLYLRCKYGKEDMERMEKKIIRCHNCNSEINGKNDFRQCSCGYQYSYKEYRRSFRRNNMPTGAAAKTFEAFMQKWETGNDYSEKMILIDSLLHEFHRSLISGATHRPVAMNFIDGTRTRVESIISNLARSN